MAAVKRRILGGKNNLNAKTEEQRDVGAVGMWVTRRGCVTGKAFRKLAESVYCRAPAPAG